MLDSNKKILVVKPPYQHIPIGLAYVLSCIDRQGGRFDFLDLSRHPRQALKTQLAAADYFAVATGGLVGDFKPLREISVICKTLRPPIPLILGGGITHDLPAAQLFAQLPVDYLVVGEAETALPKLLHALQFDLNRLQDCEGVVFKHPRRHELVRNPVRRMDFQTQDPLPGYQFIDIDYYMNEWSHRIFGKMRVIPILTGRGCKGHCAFCSPTMGRFRARSIENVIAEIRDYQIRYDPEAFVFLNEIIFENEAQILTFCAAYKKIPDFKPWFCLLRTDLDPAILPAMRGAGCMAINAGLESGSDRVLRQNQKGTTVAQSVRFIRKAREVGIIAEISSMIACEGESLGDFKKTIDLHIEEKILHPAMQFCVAYPGTRIYKNAIQRGINRDPDGYLEKMQLGMDPNDPRVCQRFYMNISKIPDAEFWPSVYSQYRRYTRFLYQQGMAENVRKRLDPASESWILTGTCPVCGCLVTVTVADGSGYTNRFFNENVRCPACKIQVFFTPYAYEDCGHHVQKINHLFQTASRPLIYGANQNAIALFLYGILNVPFRRLLGFVDPQTPLPSEQFFYFSRLSVADLHRLAPDLVLNVTGDAPIPAPLDCTGPHRLPRTIDLMPSNYNPFG